MTQNIKPDRRGQPDINPALGIDFGGQSVDWHLFLRGYFAKRLPEFRLKRNAGAMALEGKGMLDRARAHSSPLS